MRSKVPVACEASVGVLGLLGKAWKNTREVGDVFFNGKKYSKDAIRKVVDEVQNPTEVETAIFNQMNSGEKNPLTRAEYDSMRNAVKTLGQMSKEDLLGFKQQKPEIVQSIWEFSKMYGEAEEKVLTDRVNALSPQKRELSQAYNLKDVPGSDLKRQWEQTGNPNIRVSGFDALDLRHLGNPGQGTQDLLSISAITAGAVVGYSTLSHFAGGEE